MNPVEIIASKREGKVLSRQEIKYFVESYTLGEIPDYQASALLMAIYFKGMNSEETAALTEAMLNSGDKIEFDRNDKTYIDKHSSGGIGDKVSIILTPLMAACGLKIPMLSGRGLGHTGGTLDKLESIPGFRTDLNIDEFKSQVDTVGCCITGQTPEIAPADRKLYALRDVTATVESIPLICGSILSKKFAAGPNSIVFDIKVGNGAFMKSIDQAKGLGDSLGSICKVMNRSAAYLITDMNQPLGLAAGNALEIDESIAALKGEGPLDLMSIIYSLGECMLDLGGICSDEDAIRIQKENIDNGNAYELFEKMVFAQGGDTDCLSRERLQPASEIITVVSDRSGFIAEIDTYRLGRLIIDMDGGRTKVGQPIDHSVGFLIQKKIGESVEENEPLVEIHSNGKITTDALNNSFKNCFKISEAEVKPLKLVYSKKLF